MQVFGIDSIGDILDVRVGWRRASAIKVWLEVGPERAERVQAIVQESSYERDDGDEEYHGKAGCHVGRWNECVDVGWCD